MGYILWPAMKWGSGALSDGGEMGGGIGGCFGGDRQV